MAIGAITTIILMAVFLLALPVTFAGFKYQVFTGAVSSFFAAAIWCMLLFAGVPEGVFVALALGTIAAIVAARVHAAGRYGTVALAVLLVSQAVVANIHTSYALLVAIVSVVTMAVASLSFNSPMALIVSSAFSGAALLVGAIVILMLTNNRDFDTPSFGMDSDVTSSLFVLALVCLGGLLVQLRLTAPVDDPPTSTIAHEETPRTAPYAAV